MRRLNLQTGLPFCMGSGQNWRVLSKETGAHHLSVNYCVHQPGEEFSQHVHDASEDMFVLLHGTTSVRQVNQYWPIHAGDAVWVPPREVHGTMNESEAEARFLSIQSPPDEALYTGERDSMRGATAPQTAEGYRSRVLFRHMLNATVDSSRSGTWRHVYGPSTGAVLMALDHVHLAPGQSVEIPSLFKESVVIVLEGRVSAKNEVELESMDALFLTAEDGRVLMKASQKSGTFVVACAL